MPKEAGNLVHQPALHAGKAVLGGLTDAGHVERVDGDAVEAAVAVLQPAIDAAGGVDGRLQDGHGGLYGIAVDPLDMARIGQAAEHRFAGVKCGLMDQISSLFGQDQALVFSDFRTLAVEIVPLAVEICFLLVDTRVNQ